MENPDEFEDVPLDRTISAIESGFLGLKFLDEKACRGKEGWRDVERRFYQLSRGGKLSREQFGRCIGEFLGF